MGQIASTGAPLRQYRLCAGFTQNELSRRTGLSVRAIRDLESGRVRQPRGSSLRLLAEALAVRPEDLGADGPGAGGLAACCRVRPATPSP